jgi:sugar phosphate isomerase/epimerase
MKRIFIEVFGEISQEELLPMAKEIGFDGFFSGPNYARNMEKLKLFRAMGDELELEYETSHSTIHGCCDIWLDGIKGDAYIAKLLCEVDNCATINIPILIVHIQIEHMENTSLECGLKRLEPVVQAAKEKGVNIAFENVNAPEYLCKTLEYFNEPHVGFCYDSGHEACFTPGVRLLPFIGHRLMCTHLNDNDGKADTHLLPFDGEVDFDKVCVELKEIGYKGNLTFELGYSKDYAKIMTKHEFLEACYVRALKMCEMING